MLMCWAGLRPQHSAPFGVNSTCIMMHLQSTTAEGSHERSGPGWLGKKRSDNEGVRGFCTNSDLIFQLLLLAWGQNGSVPRSTPPLSGGKREPAPFVPTPQTTSPGPGLLLCSWLHVQVPGKQPGATSLDYFSCSRLDNFYISTA